MAPFLDGCTISPGEDARGRATGRTRRPRAQPQGRVPRPASGRPDRLHRPLGLRQVEPGLRHDLRRGPASIRGEPVVVRPPVPRADGQAGRRLHRGALPGGVHRPEVHLTQPSFHRGHHHRGVRLPPPAVRPHRRAALPGLRRRHRPADAAADRGSGARPAGRNPFPGAGARRPGAQGRVRRPLPAAAGSGLLTSPGRRRGRCPGGRAHPEEAGEAHHRGGGRSPDRQARVPSPADRLGGDGPRTGRWPRRPGVRRPGRGGPRSRAHVQRAPGLHP